MSISRHPVQVSYYEGSSKTCFLCHRRTDYFVIPVGRICTLRVAPSLLHYLDSSDPIAHGPAGQGASVKQWKSVRISLKSRLARWTEMAEGPGRVGGHDKRLKPLLLHGRRVSQDDHFLRGRFSFGEALFTAGEFLFASHGDCLGAFAVGCKTNCLALIRATRPSIIPRF